MPNVKTSIATFNQQRLPDEIANAITHGIGCGLSVAATVLMLVRAATRTGPLGVASAALYGASLILLYAISCVFHSLARNRGKRVMQVLDHCSIFFLIWGTYLPVAWMILRGAIGWVVFGVITSLAVLGITLTAVNIVRFYTLSQILYIAMGWAIAPAIGQIFAASGWVGVWMLVGGGIAYTVGTVFYRMERVLFMHALWHLFVIGGSICHFFFVYWYCFPRA